jgi:hypothetical protein
MLLFGIGPMNGNVNTKFQSDVRSGDLPQVRAFVHSIPNACRYKLAVSPRYDQLFSKHFYYCYSAFRNLVAIYHSFVRSFVYIASIFTELRSLITISYPHPASYGNSQNAGS